MDVILPGKKRQSVIIVSTKLKIIHKKIWTPLVSESQVKYGRTEENRSIADSVGRPAQLVDKIRRLGPFFTRDARQTGGTARRQERPFDRQRPSRGVRPISDFGLAG